MLLTGSSQAQSPPASWPNGKQFAFTVFDDPDFQTLEDGKAVYDFLGELGFRTTRGVWTVPSPVGDASYGVTCDDPGVLPWLLQLKRSGFELGLHNVTTHTSDRATTARGLDRFAEFFGPAPITMSQHYLCRESVYWGADRVSGIRKAAYTALTLGRNRGISHGHKPGHPLFWGDLCREKVRYMRNFAFLNINTLQSCPEMPYHDPERPFVDLWYAATEGHNAERFINALSEENQDRLEAEGGACIMYTHFAYQFRQSGRLNSRFCDLMRRLAKKNGWFVPIGPLLDHLGTFRKQREIGVRERARLERSWLSHKIRYGSA
jgi:hypothetical protein